MTETVYVGCVGGEWEYSVCRDSIHNIRLRPGDEGIRFARYTKGFEARQMHLNRFMDETSHDYILFLDSDMVFAPDTLERLRGHGIPYVSGLYMRRHYNPTAPVWFHPFDGAWPMKPFLEPPEQGRLHPIGASGWGCMLVHRDVVSAVRSILKGEREIMEDAMTLWPYDLPKVVKALKDGDVATLRREIRVLKGQKANVGSDIRFPFFALQAGYQLYGDPDVRPGHIISYPLSASDYPGATPEDFEKFVQGTMGEIGKLEEQWRRDVEALG